MKKQRNSGLQAVPKNTSSTVFGKVVQKQGKFLPPRKLKNIDRRSREHLSPKEVDKLINAARQIGRHGYRDATVQRQS